jgi:hypothetical protein
MRALPMRTGHVCVSSVDRNKAPAGFSTVTRAGHHRGFPAFALLGGPEATGYNHGVDPRYILRLCDSWAKSVEHRPAGNGYGFSDPSETCSDAREGHLPRHVRMHSRPATGIIDVCIANDPCSTAKCGRAGRILLGFRLWKVH